MKPINILLTLLSLNAVLITIERFSFTTKVILQPYSFLRLHEVLQMSVLILFSVLIPFFILKHVTNNFEALKTTKGTLLGVIFIAGLYFYATGNGLHEVASYFYNTFCDTHKIANTFCGSMFFNDYYTGNIIYFVGLFFFNLVLIIFEIQKPDKSMTKKDFIVTGVNSFVLALTFFAYDAFDTVAVGLIYTIVSAIVTGVLLLRSKKRIITLPYTTYLVFGYTLAAIAALIVRYHK